MLHWTATRSSIQCQACAYFSINILLSRLSTHFFLNYSVRIKYICVLVVASFFIWSELSNIFIVAINKNWNENFVVCALRRKTNIKYLYTHTSFFLIISTLWLYFLNIWIGNTARLFTALYKNYPTTPSDYIFLISK